MINRPNHLNRFYHVIINQRHYIGEFYDTHTHFFDLDGTLVDSSEGIHNGFVQTFERLGLPVPSDKKIRTFMGPPLEVTFKEEISEEGADQAVKIYRDYYETKGQLEAHLYDGIKEVLEYLSQDPNKKIYITTSKNEPTALEMCEYLGITEFLTASMGPHLLLSTRLTSCSVLLLKIMRIRTSLSLLATPSMT